MQKSNMLEDIILEAIQKIEFFLDRTQLEDFILENFDEYSFITTNKGGLEEILNEMRTMLDLLREKESGERSRLNYLLADYADFVQHIILRTVDIGKKIIVRDLSVKLHFLMKTRKRVMEFGNGEPQSVGEELGVVVGLEKDVQQLVDKAILDENPKLLILCIKGMLGAGKTTLAKQVYNHPAIVEKFKHRAWVNMSCDTSAHEVLVELIHQLVELDGPKEMDNPSLRRMLYQNMEKKPCFIVLDNMPKELYQDCIFMDDQPTTGILSSFVLIFCTESHMWIQIVQEF